MSGPKIKKHRHHWHEVVVSMQPFSLKPMKPCEKSDFLWQDLDCYEVCCKCGRERH